MTRKSAVIPIIHDRACLDWARIKALSINYSPWAQGYDPKACVQLAYVQGEGLAVRMACEENEIVAYETERDAPVFQDTCMECFINFRADDAAYGYLNFEVNANGAMLAAYGMGRVPRTYIRALGYKQPKVKLSRDDKGWGIEYTIPLELIESFYGIATLGEQSSIRANFYKCGERTPVEHYLCWSPIDTPAPDYHVPDAFGYLKLKA